MKLSTFFSLGLLTWMMCPSTWAYASSEALCKTRSNCSQLRGNLRSAGNRSPIQGATVLVIPATQDTRLGLQKEHLQPSEQSPMWIRRGESDENGQFIVEDVPHGPIRLIFIAPGFRRIEWVENWTGSSKSPHKYFLDPLELNPYHTVVKSKREHELPTKRVLSREEINTLPGTQGDPLRALQNLPGVARAPGGLGLLILRGASPAESQVFIDEHPVPRAFHFLSLASVMQEGTIANLELIPSNFASSVGNSSGGLVKITSKTPRRDGFHGHGEIDLAAASAMVEGPVGKGSFALAAQRGYIDFALQAANAVIESITGTENASLLLPKYYDYQTILHYPLGGGDFSLRILGAGDRLQYLYQPFDFRSDFHRMDARYRKTLGPWRLLLSPVFRFDFNRIKSEQAQNKRNDFVTSLRIEISRTLTKNFTFTIGSDLIIDAYRGGKKIFAEELMGISSDSEENFSGVQSLLGAYAMADLRFGSRLHLSPGVRLSVATIPKNTQFAVDPRLTGYIELHPQWQLKFGLGLYSQPVVAIREQVQSPVIAQALSFSGAPGIFSQLIPLINFDPSDEYLAIKRALQASTGVHYEWNPGYSLDLTGFLRKQHDPGFPHFFSYGSETLSYGLEFMLRKQLTRNLYGWIAYTLMKSESRLPLNNPYLSASNPTQRFRDDADQRHNFVILASYKLPNRWRIGARFRLTSGFPYTPVVGTVVTPSANYGSYYQPLFGDLSNYNSLAFPIFHQLDLRVDKQWLFKRASLSAYMDIQNVYNRQNVEAIVYSQDYSRAIQSFSLPIFPSLGIRIDY